MSDTVRQSPPLSDSGRQRLTTDEPPPAHTLTVREVHEMFKSAGIIRSERSLARWCEKNAEGYSRFDAVLYGEAGDQEKYYISPESAEAVLAEEKAKDAHRLILQNLPDSDSASEPRAAPSDTAPEAGETSDLKDRIKKLEENNLNLRAENKGYQMAVSTYENQLKFFTEKLESLARSNGVLENKLKQLEAPKENTHSDPTMAEDVKQEKNNHERAGWQEPDTSTVTENRNDVLDQSG